MKLSEFELGEYNPQSEFGRKIKQIVERGDNSDATIYWLANRVEELEEEIENLETDFKHVSHFKNLYQNQRRCYKQALEEIKQKFDDDTLDDYEFAMEVEEILEKALK